MKKSLLLFSLFSFLFSLGITFGYSSEDVSNANYLADQKIVAKQTTATGYRLDDKILRQEVIGMALKIKGVTLPENYKCKKYFTDATKNDWVCRAVELAADNGIITRSNKYANPSKYVTRAEALVMMMKAGGMGDLPPEDQRPSGWYDTPYVYDDANVWQATLIENAMMRNIITPRIVDGKEMTGMLEGFRERNVYFYPNRLATRAEVFAFAKGILGGGNQKSGIERYGITDYEKNYKDPAFGKTYDYAFGPKVPAYGEEDKMTYACLVDFIDSPDIGGGFTMFDFINQNTSTPIIIELSGKNKIPTLQAQMEYKGPTQTRTVFMKNADTLAITSWGIDCIGLMNLSDAFEPNALVILSTYYHNITSWNIESAYSMRSPAGVSLATFESWYKNTERMDIHYLDDTFKNLGNNTYEFLVDVIDNGVESTYKVKSKVNLEKFTIDNISSVKI